MSIKVMLVDDSTIVRALISRTLSHQPDIKVVATAGDGQEAISTAKIYKPDVIVLDIEMPNMDGLTALPLLLTALPNARIIMVSRLTQRNAQKSLEALQNGAADYIPKPNNDEELDAFFDELVAKVKALGESAPVKKPAISNPAAYMPALQTRLAVSQPTAMMPVSSIKSRKIDAIAIASSTGGPQALLNIFRQLKGISPRVPIFITQHMPPVFTACLASNISTSSGIICAEGKDGEIVRAGHVYLAPGGYHMVIKSEKGQVVVRLNQAPQVNSCRPAADPMFASLSEIYGAGLMAIVLTGMGRDGCDGAKAVASKGGTVISQNAANCVVYGMPKAVAEAGIGSLVLSLDEIATQLRV